MLERIGGADSLSDIGTEMKEIICLVGLVLFLTIYKVTFDRGTQQQVRITPALRSAADNAGASG